jgi:DNA-binding NtrC family response regulator
MKRSLHVLVVASSSRMATRLTRWLESDYTVSVAMDYAGARRRLVEQPDVVISELRLAEFNGLQVAMRAHASGIPVIVVGIDDPVLQRDARALGVTFLATSALIRASLCSQVTRAMATEATSGAFLVPAWPRASTSTRSSLEAR